MFLCMYTNIGIYYEVRLYAHTYALVLTLTSASYTSVNNSTDHYAVIHAHISLFLLISYIMQSQAYKVFNYGFNCIKLLSSDSL